LRPFAFLLDSAQGVAFRGPIPESIVMAVKKSIKQPVEAVAVKKKVVKKISPPVKAEAPNTVKGKTAKQKVMTKAMPASKAKPSVKTATPNSPVKK